MKRIFSVVVCFAVAALVSGCSGGAGKGTQYEKYSSIAHKFSVEVPKGAENFEVETRDAVTSGGNSVTTTLYSSSLKDIMFMVAATPVNIVSDNVKESLEKGRDAVANNGEVISKGESTLAGQPALTLVYKTQSQGMDVYYSGVFAYVEGTQFQVLFGSTDQKKLEGADAKRFFESFKYDPEAAAQKEVPAAAEGKKTSAGKGQTLESLCNKLTLETKNTVGAAYTSELENQTRTSCLAAADAYKSSPKADAAISVFVGYIMDACDGKSGQDWIACYSSQAAAAGQAAANEMMK
ncbi:MAG TPA: hypothetical protein PLK80_07285 [bacterium]|nr:MAG: hypothetical protein BWY28_00012 [bacterium ADurb.Bin236]HOY63234.1 hypothetical protein [bacterium]HPI76524.1 hypothetical protein [bacterium]HPN93143.1 hypothetical protein [bacterium]